MLTQTSILSVRHGPAGAGQRRAAGAGHCPTADAGHCRAAGAGHRRAAGAGQRGIVLMMALIVLVAMTLAGIALVRSVDTSNIIAGNLAFQQAATSAGDTGSEAAVTWLQANSGNNNVMWGLTPSQGYFGSCNLAVPGSCTPNFAGNQTWDTYWRAVLAANATTVLPSPDAAGNTVSYVIHRLCNANGDPAAVDCAEPPAAGTTAASSKTSDKVALMYTAQRFYRVTTRIAGPRNTVSYIQTIVAL